MFDYDPQYDWDDDQVGVILDTKGYPMKKVYQPKFPCGFSRPEKKDDELLS
jgi:hypothetical protein